MPKIITYETEVLVKVFSKQGMSSRKCQNELKKKDKAISQKGIININNFKGNSIKRKAEGGKKIERKNKRSVRIPRLIARIAHELES